MIDIYNKYAIIYAIGVSSMRNLDIFTSLALESLNDITQELEDLNRLAMTLSGRPDSNAIKTLELIIVASTSGHLKRKIHVGSIKQKNSIYHNNITMVRESIIGNLSLNPLNIALELMDFVISNFRVDLEMQPYPTKSSVFDLWIESFDTIGDNENGFYGRYDMVDKKLSMIDFMIKNYILNQSQLDKMVEVFSSCTQKNEQFLYTPSQLLKMKQLIKKTEIPQPFYIKLHNYEAINYQPLFNDTTDFYSKTTSIEREDKMKHKLSKIIMSDNQQDYIDSEVKEIAERLKQKKR